MVFPAEVPPVTPRILRVSRAIFFVAVVKMNEIIFFQLAYELL